ncbi:MAG TPA: nuclease-related domain-containing protein, partial [Gemmataceae bacterium]|nr:nuclease-related domain-containing protein [Gemmataceae bacterium]
MAELLEPPGGAGPVNEGERRLVAALLEHLPSNYLIAPNVEIADPGRQRYEFDAIVVAPHAVYVIEIKD